MLNKINWILAKITIFFIKIYQFTLSPDKGIPSFWLKGKICLHTPHCSQYGIDVLNRYDFIPGIIMTIERISQCHPWNPNNYDPAGYKIVFFSSAPIGVSFLKQLHEDKRFDVVGVVTTYDKAQGRGMKVSENIIKKTAQDLNIDNIQTPPSLGSETSSGKQFHQWLKSVNPDFLVVIAYGKIIPRSILDIAYVGPINIHGSILPKYRGASPIQSVLLNDEEETGITIMLMNEKMDEGEIIKILKFKIQFDWNALDIIEMFKLKGPKFTANAIREFGKGRLKEEKQNNKQATYCMKINKSDGEINILKNNLHDIYNKYRAYFLWPKIWFLMDSNFGNHKGKRVVIEKIIIDSFKFEKNKNKTLIQIINNKLILNEAIKEIIFKVQGKNSISWEEFERGYC